MEGLELEEWHTELNSSEATSKLLGCFIKAFEAIQETSSQKPDTEFLRCFLEATRKARLS